MTGQTKPASQVKKGADVQHAIKVWRIGERKTMSQNGFSFMLVNLVRTGENRWIRGNTRVRVLEAR